MAWLPALFMANAAMVMIGTMIYKNFIRKVRRELLITITVLLAAACLICSIMFIQTNVVYFFGLLLVAQAVLLAQLTILLSLFNEELFTPLESQRTFPFIESAETLGGIAGGLALGGLATFIPIYKIIIIWAISLLFILPIVLRYNSRTMDIPKLEKEAEEIEEHKKHHEKIKPFRALRKTPFLKVMLLVIILHWGMMNIIEFQYTKAIHQEVYSEQEQTLVLEEGQIHNQDYENVILTDENSHTQTSKTAEEYEQEMTQKLGILHLIFNSAALVIQLVLASRILTSIGIVSTMLLHPLITLANLAGLTLKFNFTTAALTRGSYELTGMIFKDAYHSSYYAIPHNIRSSIKEIMEGLIKPLGAIIGTIFIIVVALNYTGVDATLTLNSILIIMGILMAILVSLLSKLYTGISEKNLSRKMDMPTRLNAIEILAQKGHEKKTPSLQKILERKSEPNIIKQKILQTLGAQQDHEAVNSILKMLSNKNADIRLAAIQALSNFDYLSRRKMDQSFTKHRVIENLKKRILREKVGNIREEIVHFFHKIAPVELTKFLVVSIKKDNINKTPLIKMLGLFKDPNLKHYLEPYLRGKSPELRGASITALWQFKEMKQELIHHLNQMLESKKVPILLASIEASGEVKFAKSRKRILKFVLHKDSRIQRAAILALANMEDENVIPYLVGALTDARHRWFTQNSHILNGLPRGFRQKVETALHLHIIEMINDILKKESRITKMDKETLKLLKKLYRKIDAHHEAHTIEDSMKKMETELASFQVRKI